MKSRPEFSSARRIPSNVGEKRNDVRGRVRVSKGMEHAESRRVAIRRPSLFLPTTTTTLAAVAGNPGKYAAMLTLGGIGGLRRRALVRNGRAWFLQSISHLRDATQRLGGGVSSGCDAKPSATRIARERGSFGGQLARYRVGKIPLDFQRPAALSGRSLVQGQNPDLELVSIQFSYRPQEMVWSRSSSS
ncbi:hypothetical protein C8R46DRAFT_1120423 [Mycena filopes]|nr:hypothetical protein C8R46DRAFT_1120423 [Mycena filopes]